MFVSTSTDPIYKDAMSEMKVSGGKLPNSRPCIFKVIRLHVPSKQEIAWMKCSIVGRGRISPDKWILLKPLVKTVDHEFWDIQFG